MNRIDLPVVIPDAITMDRAHAIGRHLEIALRTAVEELVAAKVVESGELIACTHQVVLSIHGTAARLHQGVMRGTNGAATGGVRGASVAGTKRGRQV